MLAMRLVGASKQRTRRASDDVVAGARESQWPNCLPPSPVACRTTVYRTMAKYWKLCSSGNRLVAQRAKCWQARGGSHTLITLPEC